MLRRIETVQHGPPGSRLLLPFALARKAVADAWLQLAVSAGVLILFAWIFVWLMSLLTIGKWGAMLNLLPNFVQPLLGVPLKDLATTTGRLTFLYVHLVTLLVVISWALGRGSDVIGGGIARGTLELVLTLPVRRATVVLIPATISAIGCVVLAFSVWIGTWVGVTAVGFRAEVSMRQFLPGVVNLAALAFCLGGITTLVSSFDRDRWRTIWLSGGIFVLASIVKLVSRLWGDGQWLKYASFLSAFEPQQLILDRLNGWRLTWEFSGILLVLGLLCYVAAMVVFARRDIPIPR
jgi:ABC-2 type transport system permease protein